MKAREYLRRIIVALLLVALMAGWRNPPIRVQAGGMPTLLRVNTTTDNWMLNTCNDSVPLDCSLRGAIYIISTDSTTPKDFTILVPDGTYTLLGSPDEDFDKTGDLDVGIPADQTITIIGASQAHTIIDANHLDRVFDHFGAGKLTLTTMTIRNGEIETGHGGGSIRSAAGSILWLDYVTVESSMVNGSNGATDIGGGILKPGGTLNVTHSIIRNNTAVSGGGIEVSNSYLWMEDTTVSGNTADGSFGGGLDIGAGSNYTILKSRISNNSSYAGGGLYCGSATTLNMIDTIVSGNDSDSGGGGMMVFCDLSFIRGTISTNTVPTLTAGGGLYVGKTGDLMLTNATVADNTAYWGSGVFIENEGYVHFDHVTDANNNLYGGGTGSAVYMNDDGVNGDASFYFGNSIFSAFDPTLTCSKTLGGSFNYMSNGYNLYDQFGYCLAPASIFDLTDAYPALGTLAYNGGWTPTLPLYASSQAIDAADPSDDSTDQRSHSRKDGDHDGIVSSDIGAFEYESDIRFLPMIVRP